MTSPDETTPQLIKPKPDLFSNSGDPARPADSAMVRRLRNLLVVAVAVVLSVGLFLGVRAQDSVPSLASLAKSAVPLETALANDRPSLVEFYADWCTACQAMAGEMAELKQSYGDRINFVMLNVDNTKWLPEILHYRVDGIPHFVFLDSAGEQVATTLGEQPRSVMVANLNALLNQTDLPYAQGQALATPGKTSSFSVPVAPKGETDPRSHGYSTDPA